MSLLNREQFYRLMELGYRTTYFFDGARFLSDRGWFYEIKDSQIQDENGDPRTDTWFDINTQPGANIGFIPWQR